MENEKNTDNCCCPFTNFFKKLFSKLDRKLEDKAKEKSCCGTKKEGDKGCCG
ncbi:MAG: hypothetical protein HQL27_03920 [Candidatus Omnitrophica bacterium]|nr:hypothetical protein [Candidatus Omnitrophota bacterium]